MSGATLAYPDGLRGDEIPLLAQIIDIVDVYDAITSTRPYRAALRPQHADEELTREAAPGSSIVRISSLSFRLTHLAPPIT
jgi:hypothetical protein